MALSADRKTDKLGTDEVVAPPILSFPVKGSTKIYAGSMVAINSSGYAVPASADNTLKIVGRAEAQADNTSGADAAIRVTVALGVFYFATPSSGATQISTAKMQLCYASDDFTVNATDGAGLYPAAGLVVDVRSDAQVGVFLGQPSLYQDNPETTPSASGAFKARGAAYTNHSLSAFTVATNTDGITYVAGDIVLLTAQTTAAENGPYVVGTVATTAPLTRPDWWPVGGAIQQGIVIDVGGEGTLFGGSQWKAMCAKSKVIGTHDPVLYPRVCKATVHLSSGTYALGSTEGLFLYSTTTSIIQATRQTAGGTLTNTTHYYCPSAASARVAGVSGVAVATVNASVAAGTINTADTSFMDVLVTNW
jgi:hypothetical protein